MVKVAAAQIDPEIGENRKNLAKILARTEAAARNGARLIVFPECALSGYVFQSKEEALPFVETVPGAGTEAIAGCCRELGVYVVTGLLEKDGAKCYNTAVLAGPGGIIGKYRKIHLPFLGADRFTDAGSDPFRVYRTDIGNIGIHICYDCNFPESARVLSLLGADILALPTNWPGSRGKIADFVVNTRAFENRVHVIAADRVGSERGATFLGRSKIVAASGDTIAEASRDKEEIIYAEVDLSEARNKCVVFKAGEFEIDCIRDRHPALYGEICREA